MDTSKKYIKMCEKAQEIQELVVNETKGRFQNSSDVELQNVGDKKLIYLVGKFDPNKIYLT